MGRIAAAVAIAILLASAAQAAATGRVGQAGVSLALPAGWHSWVPSTAVEPTSTDPVTRIAAVSAPFTFAPRGCNVSLFAFAPTAVAIVVDEWVPTKGIPLPQSLPARPAGFGAQTLALHRPPAVECFDGPAGSTQFTEHGRAFDVFILAGRAASPEAVARARAVLDSLRVR